ncbi:MAG TPA: DeoR/GlpR family DNA-binding transcription regulator [Clostridia bacterium]|nr:DeoR/GlpR family DNA-binding transcription regulator [Clostridia bacterium]
MLIIERREKILSILHQKKFVTVGHLCELLYASPATIRRDLSEMAAQGVLKRLRGGAELSEGSNSDMPLLLRRQKDKEKKEIIASLAIQYLKSASTIFFDSSSTVFYLVRQAGDFTGKSIISSGAATINYLNEQTSAAVYCTGGRLLNQSSFVGNRAIEAVKSYCADIVFFSCCGFSAINGTTEAEEENAAVKRAMSENARIRILLCDSTKFGHDFFCKAVDTKAIDLIITDKKPDDAAVQALQGKLIYPENTV